MRTAEDKLSALLASIQGYRDGLVDNIELEVVEKSTIAEMLDSLEARVRDVLASQYRPAERPTSEEIWDASREEKQSDEMTVSEQIGVACGGIGFLPKYNTLQDYLNSLATTPE